MPVTGATNKSKEDVSKTVLHKLCTNGNKAILPSPRLLFSLFPPSPSLSPSYFLFPSSKIPLAATEHGVMDICQLARARTCFPCWDERYHTISGGKLGERESRCSVHNVTLTLHSSYKQISVEKKKQIKKQAAPRLLVPRERSHFAKWRHWGRDKYNLIPFPPSCCPQGKASCKDVCISYIYIYYIAQV